MRSERSDLLPEGARVRFRREIREPATGDHPGFLLASEDELGTVVDVDPDATTWPYSVTADSWTRASFRCGPGEVERTGEALRIGDVEEGPVAFERLAPGSTFVRNGLRWTKARHTEFGPLAPAGQEEDVAQAYITARRGSGPDRLPNAFSLDGFAQAAHFAGGAVVDHVHQPAPGRAA